jgi:pimeloyl-ACP methyl ester carboxylesterase
MQPITIATKGGDVRCEQFGQPSRAAIVWAFGAGGGFGGPAGGRYTRRAEGPIPHAIASLCVDDLLAGIDFLFREGARSVVLAGHSFGGAVVIQAGLTHPVVAAVAALSSQIYGTESVENLSPRPLLLIRGMQDKILPPF